MSVIRLQQVTCRYGAQHVFGPVNLALEADDRIGLIGPNGAGKTSLMRIMAGETPDEGRVERARHARIGHLRQTFHVDNDVTLFDFASLGFEHLAEAESRMAQLEARMASPEVQNDSDALTSVVSEYERVTAHYEADGGFEQMSRTRGALIGLGFTPEEFDRPLVTFSGGERARAQLARVLLARPDVLLLDEPTNHLDLESTLWLQETLLKFNKALVLISHDTHLLDAVAGKIWDVDAGDVVVYGSGYKASRQQRLERRQEAYRLYVADMQERERLEAYVRKYKAGSRAAQAKSREKRLARMGEAKTRPSDPARMRWRVPKAPRSEKAVCTLSDLSGGYDDALVFVGFNAEIERGQRIGIAGPNGSGKSTLLRCIAGTLAPLEGTVHIGRGAIPRYYAQDRIDLPTGMTVLQALIDAKHMTDEEARHMLARFLFRGDDVFKPVNTLSGGEQSRLALARLLVAPGNLFLLDEPTNHLDGDTKDTVLEAFVGYEGTLVFVTHDRALLQAWADTVWWVEDGEVLPIDGGYDAFMAWLDERRIARQ